MSRWPQDPAYENRYRVLDLVPHGALTELRAAFIGESPHRDEVAPPSFEQRSPFRGVAGREWWMELSRFLAQPLALRPVPPREALLDACRQLRVAVLNAVPFPIDPKIVMHEGSASEPRSALGFEKSSGPFGYKAVYQRGGEGNPVASALRDLKSRLEPLVQAGVPLVCLGNDSRWFVERAVGTQALTATIPHPSSWWRNASYRQRAVELLGQVLGPQAPGLPRRGTPGPEEPDLLKGLR